MSRENRTIKISTYHSLILSFVFVIAGILIVVLINMSMKRQALDEARAKARIILDRNLATHTYFSHDLKPAVFALTDPYRGKDYFDPVWMSSTFAIRGIEAYFQKLSPQDYYYKECAVNARNPGNEADAYERAFIRRLNEEPGLVEYSEVRMFDRQPYFVVLRRGEVLEESCLRCHSDPKQAPRDLVRRYGQERSFHRTVGDLVSAVSIRIPLSVAYAHADRVSLLLSGTLLVLLGVLYLVQMGISKHLIFTPLERIRHKAMQIATDEALLGEKLAVSSGRELNDLAAAFNTLSVNLRHGRDHLEELVAERTAELRTAIENIKKLGGLLPICSICKRIRDDEGYWKQVEVYIREHSEAEFSHSICPECTKEYYSDYMKKKEP